MAESTENNKKNWDLDVNPDGIFVVNPAGDLIQIANRDELDSNHFKETFGPRLFEVMETGKWH